MHRTSEQAEALASDIKAIGDDVARTHRLSRHGERRERLAALSERLLSAENAWDELQRVFNRESEAAEEEWQEAAEGAQIDAYLTPAEEDAVGGEFAGLTRRLEAAEGALRNVARDLRLARREAESRIFGVPARSPGVLVGAFLAATAFFALSVFMLYERLGSDAFAPLAPVAAALVALGIVAVRRG